MFVGDSVTVGTPPTGTNDFYRAKLADSLAQKFGLQAPDTLWKSANPLTGEALVMESGPAQAGLNNFVEKARA